VGALGVVDGVDEEAGVAACMGDLARALSVHFLGLQCLREAFGLGIFIGVAGRETLGSMA
jgi:hypothetical protein